MSESNLTGSIPPEIGNLTSLEWLALGQNNLTGSIPPEIGKLTNLESLFLENLFDDGSEPVRLSGPIPPELGKLTNLRSLQMAGHHFEGSLPSELGNLINLEQINIGSGAYSRLWGSIPKSFLAIKNLDSFISWGTHLCIPDDNDFQAWSSRIRELEIPTCYSREHFRALQTTPYMQFRFHGPPLALEFSPDGTQLAVSIRGVPSLWDVASGKKLQEFDTYHVGSGNFNSKLIAFSPDGTLLVTVSGYDFEAWHIASGIKIAQIHPKDQYDGAVRVESGLAFSPDGTLLAVSGHSGNSSVFKIYSTLSWEEVAYFDGYLPGGQHIGSGLAFSPDGSVLATGYGEYADNTALSGIRSYINFYDVNTWTKVSQTSPVVDDFDLNELETTNLHVQGFSSDGALVFAEAYRTKGSTPPIQAWDVNSGEKVDLIGPNYVGRRHSKVFSSDFIIANTTPKRAELFHLKSSSGDAAWEIYHKDPWTTNIHLMALSSDADFIATSSYSTNRPNVISVWKIPKFFPSLESVPNLNFTRDVPINPIILPKANYVFPPATYTLTPKLPLGLTFNATTRTLLGIPQEITNSVEYTYTVTDAINNTASATFTITVSDFVSSEVIESLPIRFKIVGNYPNPFRRSTRLRFDLPRPARVSVEIFDVTGRRVYVQAPVNVAAGIDRELSLRELGLPSGAYLYRLTVNALKGQRQSVHTGSFVLIR